MKKIFTLIISVLLLALSMCACGCDDGRIQDEIITPPAPSMSPIPTPDVDNGIIEDNGNVSDSTTDKTDDKGSASDKNNMLEEDILLSPAPTDTPEA